jgi:hypothetical protein
MMAIKHSAKAILLISALIVISGIMSAQDRQVVLSSGPNQALHSNNSDLGFDVHYSVGELKIREIQTKEGPFDDLFIEGWASSNAVGEPKLPMLRRIIAVPLGADVSISTTGSRDRQLSPADNQLKHRIIPAQESVSKSADPASLPFILKADAYARSGFSQKDWITAEELGIMRGVRIFALDFYPVRYNPVANSIQIMEELQVKITFDHPDLIATAGMLAKTGSWEFDNLYAQALFNWQADARTSLVRYPTKMLILCPPNYTDELQPFVDWKTQQGYAVTVTTVGTGGTIANTTTAIKNYMTGVWSAATAEDPAPTYLLIVGDTSTSGDNVIAMAAQVTSPSSDHITDNYYVRLSGTDYIPEMYYGRFSVSSATELTNVINKTLTFEKTQMTDTSYLGKAVMIAGQDATYGPTHGDGAINYGTLNYFNTAHGITSNTYLYAVSGTSDAAIIANANEGRGYINYTAHGSETSWADPTFTVTDVNAMTNTGKYGVMVGNCCLSNAFDTGVCFGESVLRKANAGGVAYIGGTNSTYWDEDYWWAVGAKGTATGTAPAYDATKLGVYDAMFHDNSEAFADWAQTTGDVIWMGNLAVNQGGSSYINYYWEIYSIMGDPSLMPYHGVPATNTASYPSQIFIGQTELEVTGAAPYSRIAITLGGVIHGTGIANASGYLNLPITAFSTTGSAIIVITAQNRITVIDSVDIIANAGPWMNVSAQIWDDANNDIPEYGESGYLDVTFENTGIDPATSVTATLSCATAGIAITDNSTSIASLAAGSNTTIDNAYAFSIANYIADGTSADFTITMVSGSDTWTKNFTLAINAPALSFGSMAINDAGGNNNGRLDPGETVTVTIPLNNTGGAASPSGSATLASPTSGITVNTGTAGFPAIAASGSSNLSFSLTADAGMSIGTVATLNFAATAGQYTASKTENTAVGLIIEDFATGSFASFPWIQGGSQPWTIDSATYYSAGYSAQSGDIDGSQTSSLEVTRVLSSAGNISFRYKVSSEANYDFLRFYVDGVQQGEWSGTIDWTQASYALSSGTRVLKWTYSKDSNIDTGSDCAWVDDIIFPASTNLYTYYPPQNLTASVADQAVHLTWQAPAYGTPTGYQVFRNASLLGTSTVLSYDDLTVTNGTTYSYYVVAVYAGGTSDPSGSVNATPNSVISVIIGTGTSSTGTTAACPVNQYYRSLHGQSVYTVAELNAAGLTGSTQITQIGFNITGLPAQAMPSFVVRMGHTTATNVSSWIPSSSMSTVWSSTSYLPTTTGWNMYTLSTPFTWNGTSNIVIDTAFNMITSDQYSGTTQYTSTTSGYRYVRSDSANQTNVFTGGSTSVYRPNIKLTYAAGSTSGPEINAAPTSLDFGDVTVNDAEVMQFTIQNTGTESLNGNITTPTGYSVAPVARDLPGNLSTAAGRKKDRNTISYTVASDSYQTYNLTFSPTSAATYAGNVTITSNDADEPSLNIAVTGNGYQANSAPTLDLPASLDFDKNGSLAVDFSAYADDTDGDPLTLTQSGNFNINVSISGLTVTFTAAQNWTGSETITFTVSDGLASAYDTVQVTVNPVALPSWNVVQYPNNSATVYGVVTINSTPCVLNDIVGAFVGEECRAMGEVVVDNGIAYVTLLVNLAVDGETISFRIYDSSSGTTYPVQTTSFLGFGDTDGTNEDPVPLNGTETTSQTQTVGLTTGWNLVSAWVTPADPDMAAVFAGLISSGQLVKVQDEAGNSLAQDINSAWQNTIGDLTATEGYYVQVNANCQMEFTGTPVSLPLPVPLQTGWNIISFPGSSPSSSQSVLQDLIATGLLIKVQDEQGNAIVQDIGGNWTYGFEYFTPGEAYYVNVSGSATLTFGTAAKTGPRQPQNPTKTNRY